MDNKYITALSYVVILLAFMILSLLVIITKRHPALLKRKLELGALLLSLSGISAGCGARDPFITCYVMPQSNIIIIDQAETNSNQIILNTSTSDTISGVIEMRNKTAYSYIITDTLKTIIQSNDIFPLDGSYDENREEFSIHIGDTIPSGIYDLKFYSVQKDAISDYNLYEHAYKLHIQQ